MNTDHKLDEYINGTLDADERARLEQALEADDGLAQEAAFTEALRQGIKQQPATPPGDMGLARLQRSIRQHETSQAKSTGGTQRWWKPVAIAASVLFLMQSAVLVHYQNDAPDTDIQMLSGPTAETGPVLQVIFTPETSLAELQSLLQVVEGDIVRGPGALGLYEVRLPADADTAVALSQLRASERVESASVR